MPLGLHLCQLSIVALDHRWQATLLVIEFGIGIVATFDISSHETGEGNDLARGPEYAIASVRGCAADANRDRFSDGILHLRGNRSLPDEVIEGSFVARNLAGELVGGTERVASGANRLVGLLSALHLLGVTARLVGQVLVAVHFADL